MFGAQLVNLLCNAVVCVFPRLHDRVDKIRVDSTWQRVHMQTFCMWDQGSQVDLLVHTKSCQSCACYIAAMFDDRTKNPKEQVEHCLISARKIYSLRG